MEGSQAQAQNGSQDLFWVVKKNRMCARKSNMTFHARASLVMCHFHLRPYSSRTFGAKTEFPLF